MQEQDRFQHLLVQDFADASRWRNASVLSVAAELPEPGRWQALVLLTLLQSDGSHRIIESEQTFAAKPHHNGGPISVDSADRSSQYDRSRTTSQAAAAQRTEPRDILTAITPLPAEAEGDPLSTVAHVPPQRAAPGALAVRVKQPRASTIALHECTRFEFELAAADTGRPVADLQMAEHVSPKVLVVPAHIHEHGNGGHMQLSDAFAESLDDAVLAGDKQHGLDLCNLAVALTSSPASPTAKANTTHHRGSRQAEQRFGPVLVAYLRFAQAGRHDVYLQVCCLAVAEHFIVVCVSTWR